MNPLWWPESAPGFNKERESKSSKPRELINRILVSRQLLVFEVAAIKIQAVLRRRIAVNRVMRIRRTVQVFTETCLLASEQFLDEAVLQGALELSLALLGAYAALRSMKVAVIAASLHALQSLLAEVLPALLSEAVAETIREAADSFLRLRSIQREHDRPEKEDSAAVAAAEEEEERDRQGQSRNPFLRLLRDLSDEAVDGLVRSAVCAAVLEEVEEVRAAVLAEDLARAMLTEQAMAVAEECYMDATADSG
eukprot:gene24695-33166_t